MTPLRHAAVPRAAATSITRLIAVWSVSLLVWVGVVAAAAVALPASVLDGVKLWTNLAMAGVVAVLPVIRRARPRHIWVWQSVAGVSFVAAVLLLRAGGAAGPVRYSDIANLFAFACLIVWLVLLNLHLGGADRSAFFDATSVTIGTALALWSGVIGPLVGSPELSHMLVWAVYPTVDVVILMLSIHVLITRGDVPTAMRWFVPSMVLVLISDVARGLSVVFGSGADVPVWTMAYFVGCAGLSVAAAHPSIVDLTTPPRRRRRTPGTEARVAFNVLTISPAILAIAVPISGTFDATVRSSLLALLLGVIFWRLSTMVKALRQAEKESHHRASHDQLTGLLNRRSLWEVIPEHLDDDARRGRHTAVLFFDCDDFKTVNDTWGHHAGDLLLQDIARRLPDRLGPNDVLARHSGDEFVVVASVTGPEEAGALAERVLHFFDDPDMLVSDRPHVVTPSIGVAVTAPGDGVDAEGLLGRADAAMYEAKRLGRARYAVYDAALERTTLMRAAVGDRLGAAITSGAVDVHLQPLMGGPDYGTLVGWEALARWNDTELGNVTPDTFIPLAEQLGLIRDLGAHVLREACFDLARLHKAYGRDDLSVSVNVSPSQLLQPGFAGAVRAALDDAGLPRGAVWLEITETLLVDQGPAALLTLGELRETGVRICIDDFGTGYASLATLLRLPVDCVKLDRSIVDRLTTQENGPRQVAAAIELVHSLGIERIVAEGVETEEQAALLKQIGCPLAQGWLYGRPAPPEAILDALHVTASRAVADAASAHTPAHTA